MARFQARIKPEYWHRYKELSPDQWYDVEPLWPGTSQRRLDMADKRVARLKTDWGYTSLRAEYLDFREKDTATQQPGGE
jgi:hypothetical protein